MGEYLTRIARASAAMALLAALGFLVAGMSGWAAGVVGGTLWSLANLLGIRLLILRWIRPGMNRRRPPASWGFTLALFVKFPLLYGVGYLMLKSEWFRIEGLMLGFVLPFAATFGEAFGRFIADRREAAIR